MKKKILFACCLGAVMIFASCTSKNSYAEVHNQLSDYKIVPLPLNVEVKDGQFLVGKKVSISAPEQLQNEARFLAEYLHLQTGTKATLNSKGDIQLSIDSTIAHSEGYHIESTPTHIKVSGQTPAGVFYGLQTLRQMLVEPKAGTWTILAGNITDEPRFAYRGMHLDVGRHLFPVEFIKKYIDLIALHKMNRFHWHLTEDQGWRIEIKQYPKLTEVGAWRKETAIKKNFPGAYQGATYKGDGTPYGGFYTQEEAREIVQYAADRHITVIPEIDMPGHMLAALAAYPELGNGTGPYEVATYWGVFDQILAPKEETFQFIENVLSEIIDIFPSEYIHIGGDEAPKKEWKNSAQAQALIKKLGYTDDQKPNTRDGKKHTKEEKLQSYFIQRVEKFLNSQGRQIIGWDEILEGGLAPNATVMSWRGVEGGIAAAKMGHKAIMTPGGYCYFDHYQDSVEAKQQEPFAIGGLTTVERTYSFEPIPVDFTPELASLIWGVQANLWTEYIPTTEYAEYMALPRMTALSEVQWTPSEKKDYDEFLHRIPSIRSILDKMDVNYAKHIFK